MAGASRLIFGPLGGPNPRKRRRERLTPHGRLHWTHQPTTIAIAFASQIRWYHPSAMGCDSGIAGAKLRLPAVGDLPGLLYLFHFLSCAWVLAVTPMLVLLLVEEIASGGSIADLLVELAFLSICLTWSILFLRRDFRAIALAIPTLLGSGVLYAAFALTNEEPNLGVLAVAACRLGWGSYLIRVRRSLAQVDAGHT